jgi:hypothetical protein
MNLGEEGRGRKTTITVMLVSILANTEKETTYRAKA